MWGCGKGGYSLSQKENIPLTPPRERTRGGPLDPQHCQFVARITARAAQCGCGVHGFAMNPYYSLPLATAPYCREARVTFARRRTACGMRHCFARRIVETGGRRELLRTSTRWAERQRMIGAEANRIADPNAATPRAGKCNRQALQLFELLACNVKTFLLGDLKGVILFRERE